MFNFSKCTVLIVDDTKTNIDVLINGLSNEEYDIAVSLDGPSAIETANYLHPDLILLDIMMPGMDGYEVCQILKSNPTTSKIPVIFLTALDQVKNKTKGFKIGCVDYISKPFDVTEVRLRIKTHLELSLVRIILEQQNEILDKKIKARTKDLADANAKLKESQIEVIMRLGLATEMRDDCTGEHVKRIRSMVELLAKKKGIPEEECKLWGLASTMHDIGKVGIPDAILLKPGKLTNEEFTIIKTHSSIGSKVLAGSNFKLLQMAQEIALNHHEKWNGEGYPNGISGDDIPLPARITALADVFDALSSSRPYKGPWPIERVIALLKEESGKHFDPELTRIFIESIPEILEFKIINNA